MTTATISRNRLYLPGRRLLTREEFEQIADSGVFRPEERLELIAGEIITKELPMKSPHATGVSLAEEALRRVFEKGYVVRGQLPLALSANDEPLPDVAVVVGAVRDYEEKHPMTALLVVEVSDATLRMDRTTKASLYASAEIQDYWIVNLSERMLEVYRQPVPARSKPFGYSYESLTQYRESDTVSPLAAPEAVIAVADLLPRRRAET